MTTVREFRIPDSGHPTRRESSDYKDCEKYITRKINEDDFPHSTLKLRDDAYNKKDLIISVVEDDPEVLKNILDHLNRIFRYDFSPDPLFPAANVHCVWSTNATNHKRLYGELLSEIPEDHEKVSVAILDGQLSAESEREGAIKEEYGMQVYKYLLDLKEAGEIKDLFTQFQSTVPDWVVKSGYHFDKVYGGFQEAFTSDESTKIHLPSTGFLLTPFRKIPTNDLEIQLEEFEITHGFGDNGESYQSLVKKPGLAITTRLTAQRFNDYVKEMKSFFKEKASKFYSDFRLRLIGLYFAEMSRGYIRTASREDFQQDNKKSSDFSLFENMNLGVFTMLPLKRILGLIKPEFRDLIKTIQDNHEKLNTFDADRKAMVTDKLDHNTGLWLKALFESIDGVIKEERLAVSNSN